WATVTSRSASRRPERTAVTATALSLARPLHGGLFASRRRRIADDLVQRRRAAERVRGQLAAHRGAFEAADIQAGVDPVAGQDDVVEARVPGLQAVFHAPGRRGDVALGGIDVRPPELAVEPGDALDRPVA